MQVNEEAVLAALASIKDPLLKENYLKLDAVELLRVDSGRVRLDIRLGFVAASRQHAMALAVKNQLEAMGFADADVRISGEVAACPDAGKGHLAKVKNVVMVASGKGGVGKSTTAVNLALALQAEGAKVGLLDADIYGPSQRTMLGVPEDARPVLVDEKFLQPISRLGIKSMSIGYMSPANTPMIWRGSMAVRALQQLLEQTLWGELDYLIIDMPPGTGDIQISLAQQLNVAGAVVVTTPQEVALIDARKGVEMFEKVEIPVLGIVENMSTHICANCGHEESIFGVNGAREMAEKYRVEILASLPLDSRIRANADVGLPTVANDPTGPIAQAYIGLAQRVSAQLWKQNLARVPAPQIQIVEV